MKNSDSWLQRKRTQVHTALAGALQHLSVLERVVVVLLSLALVGITIGLLFQVRNAFTVPLPARGGTFTEGVIGTPQFINPLLAASPSDRDMTVLVYSGLMRASDDGTLVHDLAETVTVSENSRVYTVSLQGGHTFHDGHPITAEDILFTVTQAKNPAIKSALLPEFEGIVVEQIDTQTVRFILSRPSAKFLNTLTLGILPEHIWQEVSDEAFPLNLHNTEPVGSGPYRITKIQRNREDIPTKYHLKRFVGSSRGVPLIKDLHIKIYPNEADLVRSLTHGRIDGAVLQTPALAEEAQDKRSLRAHNLPQTRVFGLFINQRGSGPLRDPSVASALEGALDKVGIVERALSEFGIPLDGPVPPGMPGYAPSEATRALTLEEQIEKVLEEQQNLGLEGDDVVAQEIEIARYAEAKETLEQLGWIETIPGGTRAKDGVRLALTITTSSDQTLQAVAEEVAKDWRNVGAEVQIEVFEIGDLDQDVIRRRDFEILLFGQRLGFDTDLYAFWHGSQRDDPGLNVSGFTTARANAALTSILTTINPEQRAQAYGILAEEITTVKPALFLYAPHLMYLTKKRLEVPQQISITSPAHRFTNIHEWSVREKHSWRK